MDALKNCEALGGLCFYEQQYGDSDREQGHEFQGKSGTPVEGVIWNVVMATFVNVELSGSAEVITYMKDRFIDMKLQSKWLITT